MASNTEVTQDLVIRARDLSSETIAQVGQAVNQLTDLLGKYTEMASKGEGGTNALSNSLRDADKVMKVLLANQNTMEKFAQASANMAAATTRKDDTAAIRDEYAKSLPKPAKRTDDEKNTLKDLQADATAAKREYDSLKKTIDNTSAALNKLGVDVAEVGAAMEKNAADMRTVAAVVNSAVKAENEYGAAAQAAAQKKADQAKANRDIAKAAEDEIKRRTEAESFMYADALALDKQIMASRKKQADADAEAKSATDKATEATRKEVEALKAKEVELDKLRTLAFESASSTGAIGRQGPAPDFTQTTSALRAVLDPAQAARESIQAVTKEVDGLLTAMSDPKLKATAARDGLQQLATVRNELMRQAGLVDQFKREEAAVATAQQKADQYGEVLAQLGFKARGTVTDTAKLEQETLKAGNSFRDATISLNAAKDRLDTVGVACKAAGLNIHDLGAEAIKLTENADKLSEAFVRANATANPNKGKAGFLGLQPYELTNLSYQVNDVFTQLASGTGIMQVFAQQGGQVFQLFEKNLFSSALKIPLVISGIAALALAVKILSAAAEEATAVRELNARLALYGETSLSSGRALTDLALKVRATGASFEDAKKAVTVFLEEGMRPERMVAMGTAAQHMADVLGKSVPEAAKLMADASLGSARGIKALDDAVHFMTPALADLIKEQQDLGNAQKAGELATDAAAARLKAAEGEAVSPLTVKTRELKAAWYDFLAALKETGIFDFIARRITTLIGNLSVLAGVIGTVVTAFNGATAKVAENSVGAIDKRIADLRAEQNKVGMGTEEGGASFLAMERQIKALQEARVGLAASTSAQAAAQLNLNAANQAGVAPTNAQADATVRAQTAAHTLAQQMQDDLKVKIDPTLRGQAAKDAQKVYLDEYTNRLNSKVMDGIAGKLADFPELSRAVQANVDRETKRLNDERVVRENTMEVNPLQRLKDAADAGARKGPDGLPFDKKKRDDQVKAATVEAANKGLGNGPMLVADYEATPEGKAFVLAAHAALDAEDMRRREGQIKKGNDKAINAEESLQKQLLSIREKLNNADKTNLNNRLEGIDQEFAKYDLLITKAQRAGVNKVGNQSLAEYREELATLKQQKTEQVAIEASEAGINAKLEARKTAVAAITAAMRDGTMSQEQGQAKLSEITSKLTPQISAMAKDTLAMVKALAGAEPSPKFAALIAKLEAIVNRPGSIDPVGQGKKGDTPELAGIDAGIDRAKDTAKTRDETVNANKGLLDKRLQGSDETEKNIKGAYDRTTTSIQKQTAEIRKQLEAEKAAGRISEDQYQTRLAQITEINAATQYQSQLMQGLSKEIESAFGNRTSQFMDNAIESVTQLAEGHIKLGEAIKQIGLAFANMIAGILMDIAKWIIKTLIQIELQSLLAALSGGTSTATGAVTSTATSVASSAASSVVTGAASAGTQAAVKHGGGRIGPGQSGMFRSVPEAMFVNAPRFHTGALVGLQPDEQPAILQHGEEVLAKNDPRNAMNGGGSETTSNPTNLRQVLVMDPANLSAALAGQHGEKTVITHIKNNAGAIRQILK